MAGNNSPSTNGRNGTGQFTSGNKYGKGNPHSARVAALRTAVMDSISPATAKKLVKSLVSQAMAGDLAAAKIILPYLIGQPATSKELENEIIAESEQEYVFEVVETVVTSNRK